MTISVFIIGGGSAGYTASMYAARAGLLPILYEGSQPGGQLTLTNYVENYPGYPQAVRGREMMNDFKSQAIRFGANIIQGSVVRVDFSTTPYTLYTDDEKIWKSRTVIIATGSSFKSLSIPGEKLFWGKGVSTCAVCDGFFFRDKIVAIVGGGDTASEEALHLSRICKEVHIFVRKDYMRASHIMQESIKKNKKITIHWLTEVRKILGEKYVEKLLLWDKKKKEERFFPVDGIFISIGQRPNSQLFIEYIHHDTEGYLLTHGKTTKTNIPGIFAAGDVQDRHYCQAITAAASGCMAALDTESYLHTIEQKNIDC